MTETAAAPALTHPPFPLADSFADVARLSVTVLDERSTAGRW